MTPTGLLEIPGPEQLKEEWVAAKGPKGYKRFAAYLRRYARVHGTTVASYEANDGGLH